MHDQTVSTDTTLIDALWAKSQREGMVSFVPLRAHMLDVGVAAQIITDRLSDNRRSLLSNGLGIESSELIPFVAAVAALHDIGKASPEFQYQWRDGETARRAGYAFPRDVVNGTKVRHEVYSSLILSKCLAGRQIGKYPADAIADAVAVHHGAYPAAEMYGLARKRMLRWAGVGSLWAEAHSQLVDTITSVFHWNQPNHPGGHSDTEIGTATIILASIISMADWIGSSLTYTAPIGESDAWVEHRIVEVHETLERLNWRLAKGAKGTSYEHLFGNREKGNRDAFIARPLQTTMAKAISSATTPTLVIVEAPMGEGKTEAALYASAQFAAQLGHEGLYVALPTMATSNQMYGRVREYLQRYLAENETGMLQLLHGSTVLNDNYTSTLDVAANTLEIEDLDASIVASSWFKGSKKGFLTQFAVGTIDQALYGVLPVKHWFMRLHGLANKTIVLDEVHAYDSYTGSLIVKLVEELLRMGSSVVVMSATLPSKTRRELELVGLRSGLCVELGEVAVECVAYPRITVANIGGVERFKFEASNEKTLEIRSVSHDCDSVASLLVDNANKGHCMVAIVNTVGRAQELYQALVRLGHEALCILLHGRMPGTWRSERERQVLAQFGPNGSRPNGAIVISTQVLEQSLDVDFDVMYTDLAPIDLVLQRAGRLQRHPWRERSISPILYVGGMQAFIEAADSKVVGCGSVYERFPMLHTVAVLYQRDTIHLPGEIDTLVQQVYDDDLVYCAGISTEELTKAKNEYTDKVAYEISAARTLSVQSDSDRRPLRVSRGDVQREEGDSVAAGTHIARTRLGELGLRILPYTTSQDSQKTYLIDGNELDVKSTTGIVAALRTTFTITSPFVISRVGEMQRGEGVTWECAELQGCVSLHFQNGVCSLGDVSMRLDRELGVVFE